MTTRRRSPKRRSRPRRGATATEYMLIMALVVLPLALLFPKFLMMVGIYGNRVTGPVSLPFP